MKLSTKVILIIVLVLIFDQVTKTIVKNYMHLGQEFSVIGSWFRIHFIENEGMAFGIVFGIKYGKLLLSLLRIIFSICIAVAISNFINQKKPIILIISLCLILAGAIGNLIDSIFYGIIYNYAPIMHGRVVDMLYFPIVNIYLPKWVPIWGGEYFNFFSPIFNIADSSITIGVVLFAIFYNKELNRMNANKEDIKATQG